MFITTQPCELNAIRDLLNLRITAVSFSSDFIVGINAIGAFMSAAPATRHCEQYVLSLPTPKSLNTSWASQNGFVTSPCRRTSPDTEMAYQGQCYPTEDKKGKKIKQCNLFFYKFSRKWLQVYFLKGSSLLSATTWDCISPDLESRLSTTTGGRKRMKPRLTSAITSSWWISSSHLQNLSLTSCS